MPAIPFFGSATALITPFTEDDQLDVYGLKYLIDRQIKNGTQALVIAGTTGEASTLDFEEYSLLIAKSNEFISNRVPFIAGSGSNNTNHAIKLSLEAQKRGADALLIVTPYYNKTTQAGLIAHYKFIAERVHCPIILYNVPSRTGMSINTDTLIKLSETPSIVGIKEAGSSIAHISEITGKAKKLCVYSGNDDQIVPIMSLGGKGVISVIGNIDPKAIRRLCDYALNEKFTAATAEQHRLLPLIQAVFSTVNPIGVKHALNIMGLPSGKPRLPLIESDEKTNTKIESAISDLNINY